MYCACLESDVTVDPDFRFENPINEDDEQEFEDVVAMEPTAAEAVMPTKKGKNKSKKGKSVDDME